jgi:hypothetical protein
LDREITEAEIITAINKNLKRKKSHGVDGLLNEYFFEFKDFLMPTLLRVFNEILQSGIFSTAWAVAVLVPCFLLPWGPTILLAALTNLKALIQNGCKEFTKVTD